MNALCARARASSRTVAMPANPAQRHQLALARRPFHNGRASLAGNVCSSMRSYQSKSRSASRCSLDGVWSVSLEGESIALPPCVVFRRLVAGIPEQATCAPWLKLASAARSPYARQIESNRFAPARNWIGLEVSLLGGSMTREWGRVHMRAHEFLVAGMHRS